MKDASAKASCKAELFMSDKNKSVTEVYELISQAYAVKFCEPSDNLDDFLKFIPKGGRILDAGCGPGVDSSYMMGKGFEVLGIDLSAKMLELAMKKNPDVKFRRVDIRELDFNTQSFDAILASYSLIHITKQDIPRVIKNFHRMLKPTGVLFIGVQEGTSKEVFITEPLKPDKKIFINIISAKEIKELLEVEGFKILREFTRRPENIEELEFNKYMVLARVNAI